MFPGFTQENLRDSGLRNTKLLCYGFLRHARCAEMSDLDHLGRRELYAWGIVSALRDHIAHVVGLYSKPQVSRINTGTVVAGVMNLQAVRNHPFVQFIREAMGKQVAAFNAEDSMPICALCPLPLPALVGGALGCVFPKTFLVCWNHEPIVSSSVKGWIPLDVSQVETRNLRNWSELSATTQAKATGVRIWIAISLAHTVAAYKFLGLPLDYALAPGRTFCNVGFLATTAMAVTIRDFMRGIVRGMIAHVASPFLTIGHATERCRVAVALLLGNYICSIPQDKRQGYYRLITCKHGVRG